MDVFQYERCISECHRNDQCQWGRNGYDYRNVGGWCRIGNVRYSGDYF